MEWLDLSSIKEITNCFLLRNFSLYFAKYFINAIPLTPKENYLPSSSYKDIKVGKKVKGFSLCFLCSFLDRYLYFPRMCV